jgi:chromate transporter
VPDVPANLETTQHAPLENPDPRRWPEVLALAVRLGLTAFGGPAVHVAMLRDQVVTRKSWVSDAQFLDWLGAVNLIPGPNSTEMVMHVGLHRAGWRGLIAAGLGFILPAATITLALAWVYVTFGSRPDAAWFLYGLKPVIVAVVMQAIYGLARTLFKSWQAVLVSALVLALYLLGVNEIALLFGGALIGAILKRGLNQPGLSSLTPLMLLRPTALSNEPSSVLGTATASVLGTAVSSVTTGITLGGVFWGFLKIGLLLYGGGYVLLAFLRSEFVTQLGWLTEQQLLDAVAVGQFTPGPLFSSATFVGYIIAGVPGAILATVAIFGPAFVFVGLTGSLVARLRKNAWTGALLDGVNAAAIGLMVGVTLELGRAALVDALTVVLALVTLGLLVRFTLNSAWLVLGGAIVGWISSLVR